MLDWQARGMPPAMDVAGPTVYLTMSKIVVEKKEKVIDMLSRLQDEQRLINRHDHAPLDRIVSILNNGSEARKEFPSKNQGPAWLETEGGEGNFMCDAMRRHYFDWLPINRITSPQIGFKRLQGIQLESRADVGCTWFCSMLDHDTVVIHVTWDDAQWGLQEVEDMLTDMVSIAEMFAKEENWEKAIEEFVS